MAAAPGLGHLRRWCLAGVVSAVGWLQTSRQRCRANSQERGGQLSVWEEGLRGSAWDGEKGGTAWWPHARPALCAAALGRVNSPGAARAAAQVTRGGGGEHRCRWPPTWRRRELRKEDPLPAYSGGQEQRRTQHEGGAATSSRSQLWRTHPVVLRLHQAEVPPVPATSRLPGLSSVRCGKCCHKDCNDWEEWEKKANGKDQKQ